MRKFDILVIDDEEDPRHEWFREVLLPMGHQVRSAYTAQGAVEEMAQRAYDVVFFDHDLGQDPVNGSMIAGRVLNDPGTYQTPAAVWVHSMNWNGALNIASKFRSAGIPTIVESFAELLYRNNLQEALEALVP